MQTSVNVYDFDHTIYDGDCTLDFWLYALQNCPVLIKFMPQQIFAALQFKMGIISREDFKEKFYIFLSGIDKAEETVIKFWKIYQKNLMPWYKNQHRDTDIVISASPEFIVKVGCMYLGVTNVIASKVDCKTGKCSGKNCRSYEKVVRFKEEYNSSVIIDNFYSDSKADEPLAKLAKNAFIIKNGRKKLWIFK
jgi:phosphatidylglycerophosphatase C